MIFYFTGTGNCLYVAKKIGGELISISQAYKKQNQIYRDDVIGFVCPTYAVGIPRIVQKFIRNNTFQAKYSFAVMTCGGMLGSSLMQFEKLVSSQGLTLDYTNKVVMIDNYGMKNMSEKLRNHNVQEETMVIEKIAEDIRQQKQSLCKSNLLMVGLTKLLNFSSGLCYDKADKHFTVQTDKCVKCGLCQRICPADNISLSPYPTFSHKCEGCYACIHACPEKVISPNRYPVEKQYRHPQISLSELLNKS